MWSVETRSRVGYDLIISNLIWNGFIKQFSPPRPALLTHVIRCSSAQDKAYKHLFLVHWSCCRINISISVYCAGLVVMLQPSPWCFVAIRDWIVQTTAQYQWSLIRQGKTGTRRREGQAPGKQRMVSIQLSKHALNIINKGMKYSYCRDKNCWKSLFSLHHSIKV